jgi:hypothetical protein
MPPTAKHTNCQPTPRLALRRFRPAIPARVAVSANEVPVLIGFAQKRARVIQASGPWQSNGEWWAGEWKHSEWDINLTLDGHTALYRVFRDLITKAWFVEGKYD